VTSALVQAAVPADPQMEPVLDATTSLKLVCAAALNWALEIPLSCTVATISWVAAGAGVGEDVGVEPEV